jgi:RHH-type rel operon transcriptional repressor/antitoxin RelB
MWRAKIVGLLQLPDRFQTKYNLIRCSQEASITSQKIITLRLDGGLTGELDKLARAMRRSRSFLAAEAIRNYIALNRWQVEEIHNAPAEADRGEFATESEVKRVAKEQARRAR